MNLRPTKFAMMGAQSMKTNTNAVIVCRTLRQVDALVAESLFGWRWWLDVDKGNYMLFPPECRPMSPLMNERWTPKNPNFSRDRFDWSHTLHHYTTWAELEAVIRNREEAGYAWDMECRHQYGNYAATLYSLEDGRYWQQVHQDKAVALCLAALASVGLNVTYSPEEETP
jgi:hypothetical protein